MSGLTTNEIAGFVTLTALAGPDTRFASPLNLYFIGQTTNKSQSTKLRQMRRLRGQCKPRVDTNMTLVPTAGPIPRAPFR